MADVVRTCTNCGNAQATGDFCEKCGTRLPSAAEEAAASQSAGAQAASQPGGSQQGTAAQGGASASQPPAQPQPAPPSVPTWLSRVFDLSLQGLVTRGSLKVLYVTSLVLIGICFLLSIIFFGVAAGRIGAYWCIGIFVTIAVVPLMIGWTRVMLELAMTVSKLREDLEKPATKKSSKAQ